MVRRHCHCRCHCHCRRLQVKAARRALLLSGTPALNKPKELYQQLAVLLPAAKLKMSAFGERYCHVGARSVGRAAAPAAGWD